MSTVKKDRMCMTTTVSIASSPWIESFAFQSLALVFQDAIQNGTTLGYEEFRCPSLTIVHLSKKTHYRQ